MSDLTPFQKLVKHYGSQKAVAERFTIAGIELGPMAITQWRRRGIPVKHCPLIEADTGIPCHELRPDVFPAPNVAA